jgi:hypothetical protein
MKCAICGCSENDACPEGCGWAETRLCTVCAELIDNIRDHIERARLTTRAGILRAFEIAQQLSRASVLSPPQPARRTTRRAS